MSTKRKPDEGDAGGDAVAAEAAERSSKAREKPLACDGVNCNNVCMRLSIYMKMQIIQFDSLHDKNKQINNQPQVNYQKT